MPGVSLDLKRLEDLIQRKGVWLDWFKTHRCPCLGEDGYHDPRCPICEGLGWSREPKKRIRALFTEHRPKRNLLELGVVEAGSRNVTPQRWVRFSEGDWLVQTQFHTRTSQVITYGGLGREERLDALFPERVIAVRARRCGQLVTIPPACYTDPDTKATFAPGGLLAWQDGAEGGPEPGERLSVEFYELAAWQLYRGDGSMERGTEDRRLMDHVLARRITRRRLQELNARE